MPNGVTSVTGDRQTCRNNGQTPPGQQGSEDADRGDSRSTAFEVPWRGLTGGDWAQLGSAP